ncbi:MAG TPA: potassium transporter TrkG [Thermomicrobiales bacterium]|nr:potassium transporter TrkG [Thermomicrobiales bacterium]
MPQPTARRPTPSARRNARIFVAGLLVVVCAGALLLATPWTTRSGDATPPVDAVFTAVSAVSVTGLVTVETAEHWNFGGQVVILALIQIGGLGFMVGTSLVLRVLQRSQSSLRGALLLQDGSPTLSLREAVELSGRIVRFTLVAEAMGTLFLALRFSRDMPAHDAIWQGTFHSISAFCNAGFDLRGGYESMIGYQTSLWVNAVLMTLIQLGALSFIVLADVGKSWRWRRLAFETKLVLALHGALLAVAALLFLAMEWNQALESTPAWAKPMAALFQSVSARTAGFATVGFDSVTGFTLFFYIGVMFIGGASGSTAGGVKLATAGVVFAAIQSAFRGQMEPHLFGRRVGAPVIMRALSVIVVMFAAHFVVSIGLMVVEDITHHSTSPIALMFEAMSALATVGLSTGVTPDLAVASKLILCGAMLFGRLGPLTVVYALQRRQRIVNYRFPAAQVNFG